jgi:hypothetical protein
MPLLPLTARCTQQPTQAPQIDWSNPITQGLAFAFAHGPAAMGWSVNGQSFIPYSAASMTPTLAGTAAKSNSSTSRAYQISGNHGITSTNYSLFAVGTASSGVTQNAIDADNSSPRYFQFRINANKVEFIPFNTSAAVTGQPVIATALTAAELARGIRMGATASPTRTAAFQNGQIATATPSSLIAPTTALPLSIGVRATGTAGGWNTGGLAMVAGWSRTLSDAEMLSLCDNPWQIFCAPARRTFLQAILDGLQSLTVIPVGGITLAGAADTLRSRVAAIAGGLVMAGTAPASFVRSRIVLPIGGLALAGSAAFVRTCTRVVSGGLKLGGAALVQTGGVLAAIASFLNIRRRRRK